MAGDGRWAVLAVERRVALNAGVAIVLAVTGAANAHAEGPRAPAPAGHVIAQRFSDEAERATRAAEAAQNARRVAESQRKAAAKAESERQRQEAAQKAWEADLQARAREEVEARRAEQARVVAEEARRAEETRRVADEARRAEETRRVAEEARRAEEAREVAAERDEDIERVVERLRRIREAHASRRAPTGATVGIDGHVASREAAPDDASRRFEPPTSTGGYAPPLPDERVGEPADMRVTVLLLMEPGDRGIRRHNRTADPLLCVEDGCYISNGPSLAATLLPRWRALGLANTLGRRAAACRDSLGCVFRDVELSRLPAFVQPVDMRLVRHDRREAQLVRETSRCGVRNGQLTCSGAIDSGSYRMWIIPERVVNHFPPELLLAALASGLVTADQAGLARH